MYHEYIQSFILCPVLHTATSYRVYTPTPHLLSNDTCFRSDPTYVQPPCDLHVNPSTRLSGVCTFLKAFVILTKYTRVSPTIGVPMVSKHSQYNHCME